MNILYLTSTGKIIGGGEVSLFNLLKNLNHKVFRPHLISVASGDFTQKISELNIPVKILPLKKVKNFINFKHNLSILKQLKSCIAENNISLIHCNSIGGITLMGAVAAHFKGIPFVWHVRAVEKSFILDAVCGMLSSRIICISAAVAGRFKGFPFLKKICLIHNGVDTSLFNPASLVIRSNALSFRKEIGCSESDFIIGAVGRYHPMKSYEYLIRALKVVVTNSYNVKVVFIGMGYSTGNPYLLKLKSLTSELGLEQNVIFMGQREDIASVMSSFNLFVLPSENEPFGRVVIEAMACGLAVIAFRSGGLPEIVKDKTTGFLINPFNVNEMADKIIYLKNNGKLRRDFGEKARERAVGLFDIKAHTKEIEELYLSFQKQ
ncbi:MAG: glycosyltransferase family 4 protein [Candidatus Omnitrophota bacterium]